MKKIIGILMIIGGLWMIASAISSVNDINRINETPRHRIKERLSPDYSARTKKYEENTIVQGVIGALLLIFGIIFVASKSKEKQFSSSNNDYLREKTILSKKAAKLYSDGDFHGAIPVLKNIIQIDPYENKALFNLACCYSKMKNYDCFGYLEKAITNGYNDFDRIRNHSALNWMRNEPEWEIFVQNGYELKEQPKAKEQPKPNGNVNISDDLVSQLERLGQLRDKGLLTEEEFQEQKKRLIK